MATEAVPAEIGVTHVEGAPEGEPDRRGFPRFPVDCSVEVLLLTAVSQLPGRMRDLSMSGCHIETEQRFVAGVLSRVEVQFQLRGIAFRLVGVTAGTRSSTSFAVRFLEMSRNRQEDLAEVIAEVAAIQAASEAALEQAPEEPSMDSALAVVEPDLAGTTAASDAPLETERRTHGRLRVDSRAKLFLVKTAIVMDGRILDLSLGGCRLRTDERFSVGVFVRVEAEFYLHGLPFRVAGVVQAIVDANTIGIRFLDMSERRREQLTELVAEMAEPE